MSSWLNPARAADLILLVMLAEAVWLIWRRRRRGGALPPAAIARMLLPGALLVLALRLGEASPAAWPALGLCLAAAFVAHLVDLRSREAEAATRTPPPAGHSASDT